MEWKLGQNNPIQAREYFERKMTFTLGPIEVKYYLDQGEPLNLIDVRSADEFAKGHVPGAISLPESDWDSLRGLRMDRPNIIYCYSVVCHLAAKAAIHFAAKGFSVMEMDGGYDYWKKYELAEERSEAA